MNTQDPRRNASVKSLCCTLVMRFVDVAASHRRTTLRSTKSQHPAVTPSSSPFRPLPISPHIAPTPVRLDIIGTLSQHTVGLYSDYLTNFSSPTGLLSRFDPGFTGCRGGGTSFVTSPLQTLTYCCIGILISLVAVAFARKESQSAVSTRGKSYSRPLAERRVRRILKAVRSFHHLSSPTSANYRLHLQYT